MREKGSVEWKTLLFSTLSVITRKGTPTVVISPPVIARLP